MRELPILFSSEMVRAIVDGRKTQTRRIVKDSHAAPTKFLGQDHTDALLFDANYRCPFGASGDRLYVRETWQHSNYPFGPYEPDCTVFYRADYLDDPHGPDGEKSPEGKYRQWRPSIHMPRSASRITLDIVDVRVEQLQDISDRDAEAEGVLCETADLLFFHVPDHPRDSYRMLWDSLNASRGYGWKTNPWVWVVSFKAEVRS